jgi:hypothetical protein
MTEMEQEQCHRASEAVTSESEEESRQVAERLREAIQQLLRGEYDRRGIQGGVGEG